MLLSRFLKDRRGGVAPMFALAIIPVVGFVGAAIDYSRANSVRAGMQSALDATSLAMAKLAPTLTQSQLQTQTTAYFKALFNQPEAKNVDDHADLHDDRRLAADRSRPPAAMDTAFMKVMGYSSLNIGSSSDGQVGQQPPARRARARQYRLDERRRQDRRAQDRDQEPADPAQDRRDQQRRRLRVDHSVQQGRECRLVATTTPNWIDWARLGRRQRPRQSTTTCTARRGPARAASRRRSARPSTQLDAGQSQHLERLRHRPRPELRRRPTPRRRPATPATLFPAEQYDNCPVADDGAELRLDRA